MENVGQCEVSRVDQADGQKKILVLAGEFIRLGRDTACEVTIDPVAFPKVSGIHARIEATPRGFVLVHLSQSNKTLLNNASVDNSSPIKAGDCRFASVLLVRRSRSWRLARPAMVRPAAIDSRRHAPGRLPGNWPCSAGQPAPSGLSRKRRCDRPGREGRQSYLLDHPHVSRNHASLALRGDRVVLADLGSSNGTYVNGQRLTASDLRAGDRIEIGPFSLRFDGSGADQPVAVEQY